MKRHELSPGKLTFTLSVSLIALLCAGSAVAQETAVPLAPPSKNSPVAYVYVSNTVTSRNYQINAYAAAANGALTPVAGSPFPSNGDDLAVNNQWLFSTDTVDIFSYSIAANGALKHVATINAQHYNNDGTGGPISLFFDRTGAVLYDEDIYGNASNNTYQFFNIDQANGSLSYIGATGAATAAFLTPLTFIGNNQYAYGASCIYGFEDIYGFNRLSDGRLTDLNISPPIPAAPNGAYCPYFEAADAGNDVAISLTPNNDLQNVGPAQLAVYTADADGNLTTNSTWETMPVVAVGNVNYLQASPAGNLLAVGGQNGLQVFHFNGANPITKYTGLLTSDPIFQTFWDNANHLYAISPANSLLYVFNVTPTTVTKAPGSPYTINGAQYLAVLPK